MGSLYIPPINQQPQLYTVSSPPSPPKRDLQSPQIQSPSLKEAPKPWQKQAKQAEELPAWAKREPAQEHVQQPSPPLQAQQQQQQQQQRFSSQKVQQVSSPVPPQNQVPQSAPNAVYVTQPVVYQHPGSMPNQHQPRIDGQGAVIIPVRIEGSRGPSKGTAPATPITPGNERLVSTTPKKSIHFRLEHIFMCYVLLFCFDAKFVLIQLFFHHIPLFIFLKSII